MDAWEICDGVLGKTPRTLLYGPPGTGKTYAACKTGLGDRELFQITLHEETSAIELRGTYMPNEQGAFRWMHGPAMAAWLAGGRLVLNEIDHASADALTFLHAVLDDPEFAKLTLPTDPPTTVRPVAGFDVIATMNGRPEDLPEAVADRFPVRVFVPDVNPKAILALPVDLQEAARSTVLHSEVARRLALRQWLAFADLRGSIDPALAIRAVFGPRAADVERALVLQKEVVK